MQTGQPARPAMLLYESSRSGVVERIEYEIALLQQGTDVAFAQFLRDQLNLDASGAEQTMAKHLGLPGADVGFMVNLRADVGLLDAVAVDDAQGAKALAYEVIGQV